MYSIQRPEEILHLLQEPQPVAGSARRTLINNASVKALLEALVTTDSNSVKQSICYVLGIRTSKRAVPVLIKLLGDPASEIRSVAAESLANIGSSQAGASILKQYIEETDMEVKRMQAVALGATHYAPAVPRLAEALFDRDASLRGSAAWSLGEIGDVHVLRQLETALEQETNHYARERLQKALEVLHSKE